MPEDGAGVLQAGRQSGQYLPHTRQHYRSRPTAGIGWERRGSDQALGRACGGLTTKVYMLADTFGRFFRLCITAGQAQDITTAANFLEGRTAAAVLAEKAHDGNDLRERIADLKAEAVVRSSANREVFIPHDEVSYGNRN